jgi:hypothetical protein
MATSSFIIIGYCSSGANATYIPTPHYVATGYYDPTTFMPKANPFTNQYGTFVGWSTVRNMTVSATGRTGLTATNFWAAGTAIPLGSKGLSKHTILYAVWDVLPKYVITVTFDPNIPAGTEAYAAAWGIVTTVQTKTFNTADGAPVLDIGGVPNFLSTFFITSIPRHCLRTERDVCLLCLVVVP